MKEKKQEHIYKDHVILQLSATEYKTIMLTIVKEIKDNSGNINRELETIKGKIGN